ncbi:hypothetical protein MMC14_002606 [Varicellaria rhodocarpa]|nr:hypothetical protein [Varicellaria rhodocarpa]
MPSTCPPIKLPHNQGGNIFVAEIEGLCHLCEEEAKLAAVRGWISGGRKNKFRSQDDTLVNNTAMTTPMHTTGMTTPFQATALEEHSSTPRQNAIPKTRDGPIIADSSAEAADDIEDGTEVGSVVYRRTGWELLKRASSAPPWGSYGWFSKETPAMYYPEMPRGYGNEMPTGYDDQMPIESEGWTPSRSYMGSPEALSPQANESYQNMW